MKKNKLDVYINSQICGTLDNESNKFIFNYRSHTNKVASLTMPIRSESWTSKTLHPIFQMNMPEGTLREVIKNAFSKIEKMDDMGFLKIVGPHVLGRVKFGKMSEEKETLTLDDILSTTTENLFEELMDRFAIRSGVSGVQPKLLLSAQNKTTMKFEHYIVKSWQKEYPNLALNEYFCMRAVQHSGLDTPAFYLSDDLSLFVIERFDVKEEINGKHTLVYRGFEDMCVLTARGTDEKYDGSYEEVARVIKDIIAPERRRMALKTLVKAIIMNHFLRNGDGHLKNYGIVYDDDYENADLAPIYDVISTTMYIKKDIPALCLGANKLWWKEKTYKNFAKSSCGLSQKEYDEIVSDCSKAILKTKEEMLIFRRESEEIQTFLEALGSCWLEEFTN